MKMPQNKKIVKKKDKSDFVNSAELKVELPTQFVLNASTVPVKINDHNYILIRSAI